MKDPLLEEFKVWLTDNGYERIDSQLNIHQSAMFQAYKAGRSGVTSARARFPDEKVPELFAGTNEALDNLIDKVGG